MKTCRVVAPGKFIVEEIADPAPGPGEVLIRPIFLAICGSDIYVLHHMPPDTYPKDSGTTGHEMVGIVEGLGPGVEHVAPGDLVLGLSPNHTAMSELYCGRADKTLKLPPGKSLEELLMAQQLGTVIYSCDRLPDVAGKTALVLGQGSAGLFFNAMLKRLGVSKIIACDLQPARLALSRTFGADKTFLNTDHEAVQKTLELNDGKLPDIVIEATGEIEGINLAPRLVAVYGLMLFFGVPHKWRFEFDYFEFYRRYATTITNSGAMDADNTLMFSRALDLIAGGEIPAAPMITHRFPFSELSDAYECAKTKSDGAVKVIVEMPGSESFRNHIIT